MNADSLSAWLKKANEDLSSAETLLRNDGGFLSTVCFLSQQSAEKVLKGFLSFLNIPFLKVHDLLQLESIINLAAISTNPIHECLIFLNRFYIETRYPGDHEEFTWNEAKEAHKCATAVESFISQRIKTA